MAQALSVIVLNWTFFMTLQGIVMFRHILMSIWKRIAFFTVGTFTGICSSLMVILSLLLGLLFMFGKEGSFYINEYQAEHIFPLVSIICLEFTEFLVIVFKFFMVKHTDLQKSKISKVENVIDEIKSQFAVFKKPNLAMLQ